MWVDAQIVTEGFENQKFKPNMCNGWHVGG